MCSVLVVFVLGISLFGVSVYEALRWTLVQEACNLKRETHLRLLQSDVCKSGYGVSVETVCEKAQIELRSTLFACTATTFWRQGEIYALYTKVTESYILLGCIVLIPLLYIIHKVFDLINKRNAESIAERIMMQQYNSHPAFYPQLAAVPSHSFFDDKRMSRRPQSQFVYEAANRDRDI